MKKIFLVLMVLCVVGLTSAESYNFGPYKNYQGTQEVDVTLTVPTTTNMMSINDPWGGSHHIAAYGGQEMTVHVVNYPVIANSFLEFDSEEGNPLNPETGNLILTEVWAHDLAPGGLPFEPPMSEGFTLGDVEITVPGFYTGQSTTNYPTGAPQVVTIADLPTTLPGYDVSSIVGSPTSVVIVTQATVPAYDFIVEMPSPYFLVDSQEEWQSKLDAEWPEVQIRPLTLEEGNYYLSQLDVFLEEGQEYSPIPPDLPEFVPPQLYVYEGDEADPDMPDDPGLVMKWGDETTPDGEKMSGWAWDYHDPDLSNCIITVTASPPGPSGINRISLGMQDINGNIRSWWWNVPSVIPYTPANPPTTITIDTSLTGIGATNPPASGFANNPAFNITQVQNIVADENANWVGTQGAPAPGGTLPAIWNYWHNLSVTPKLPGGGANSKWFVKWSQGPDEIADGLINGWDEQSLQIMPPIMADDWECDDERPVTDIHWWGSFIGWTQPHMPPIVPSAFHIGIWTDVPDPNPGDPADGDWSHPGTLIWENICTTSVWNFAGYDLDPRDGDPEQTENEACFQWAQFLNQDEWFHQQPMEDGTPNVYWLSIAAIYPAGTDFQSPDFFPWGWKTRPHHFNDDAVRILLTSTGIWPPALGSTVGMTDCDPVEWPVDVASWDLAFELTTNEPGYLDNPTPGDISGPTGVPDGNVDLIDLSVVAANWLTSVTP